MPGENLEYVRELYAKWERGDFRGGAERFHPEIHFEPFMPDAERVVARGLPEVARFMADFLSNWDGYRLAGDEFVAVGEDVVLVVGHQTARGKYSGADVHDTMCSVWTFRDGLVVRLVYTRDPDEARRLAHAT